MALNDNSFYSSRFFQGYFIIDDLGIANIDNRHVRKVYRLFHQQIHARHIFLPLCRTGLSLSTKIDTFFRCRALFGNLSGEGEWERCQHRPFSRTQREFIEYHIKRVETMSLVDFLIYQAIFVAHRTESRRSNRNILIQIQKNKKLYDSRRETLDGYFSIVLNVNWALEALEFSRSGL